MEVILKTETKQVITSEHNSQRILFPFSAIVAQEQMKLALILNAISPSIGGVLIRGEKGTAKSTAVRALSELLPTVTSATGEPALPPFVDLPLGATEDRVVGSIDLERALKEGKPRLQPGLLAKANKGILYIDEVNLLDDHLVDSILDVAESGVNIIEREGLSDWHPSSFILVGTMNPEEGDLRPQLLDRFALAIEITGEKDIEIRKKLLRVRERFDSNPQGLRKAHFGETQLLRKKIEAARARLKEVFVPKHLLGFISEICSRNHVAGHRADLVIKKAAKTLAAWSGRTEVHAEDISTVAPMALLHRMRTAEPPEMPPPPEPPSDHEDDESSDQQDESKQEQNQQPERQSAETEHRERNESPEDGEDKGLDSMEDEPSEQDPIDLPPPPEPPANDIQPVGDPYKVKRFHQDDLRQLRSGSGRRNRTRSATRQGRYIKSSYRIQNNDLALDATLRAAAPYQKLRRERSNSSMAVHIDRSDKRGRVREKRIGSFMLFAVDGSGSMGAQKRMTETKSAILSLLLDAYQKRDKVAMISFRGRESEVVLPPTNSVELAAKLLNDLPVGGRTPLSAALVDIENTLNKAFRKEPNVIPIVMLLTDGRANAGLGDKRRPHEEALYLSDRLAGKFQQVRFVVVDTEPPGLIRLGLAEKIAHALRADYFKTTDLKAEDLIKITKN